MLVLIRGIPGSGKSTYAKMLLESHEVHEKAAHFEADDFWEDKEFNPKFLGLAHKICQENTREALEGGFNVIVANTFSRLWEIEPYITMAKELGVEVKVIRMTKEYGSIHNVPEKTVEKMKKRFEDYEGEKYVC